MALAAVGVYAVGVGAQADRYLELMPGLIVFAFGAAVALPAMTTVIMASVESSERGMVSGVYNTARLVGATMGLAVMGSVLASLEQAKLDDELTSGQLTQIEQTRVHHFLCHRWVGE